MKFFYTWLLVSLGILMSTTTLSTQTLVTWPLTGGALGNPQVQTSAVIGTPFLRGNGLSTINFTGAGADATSWSVLTAAANQVDFYEFGLAAAAGETIQLTGLAFNERREEEGPRNMRVVVSRDDFLTEMEVAQVTIPDNLALRSHNFGLNLKIQDGEALRFRIYGLEAESESGLWLIQSNTLTLSGAVLPTCNAPSSTGQLSFVSRTASSITIDMAAGNGQGRLLCMAPFDAPLVRPYQGDQYTGNLSYGDGDPLGPSAYVVAVTNAAQQQLTITDLEPGTNYQLTIIEYDDGEMCYAKEETTILVNTSCSSLPRSVQNIRFTSLDAQVAIRWDPLTCIEKYLVVGSEDAISGSPIGESFTADTRFGQGEAVSGISGNAYALYFTDGPFTGLVAEDLTNGTNYHFAIYVLRNGQWSTAKMFQSQPEAACPGLEPERIFINEIHYVNGPVSQDQGVEIAGPAGVDLSNYELLVGFPVNNQSGNLYELYRHPLSGFIDDESEGMGAVWFPLSPLEEVDGGVALVNKVTGQPVDLVIYQANQGIQHWAALLGQGQGNSGAGIWERATDPAGFSLQLTGEGTCAGDFTWARLGESRGFLNLGQAVLPVELNFLAAEPQAKIARIFWQTATESGSDYFRVEHSNDGRTFTTIGEIPAAGFSNTPQDYELYDLQPADGLNYYRLRQVDYDGTVHDEGIVTVRFASGTEPPLSVFPNPVTEQATLTWNLDNATAIQLMDTHGRTLARWHIEGNSESGSRTLDMGAFPAGTYLVRVLNDRVSEIQRIVKH